MAKKNNVLIPDEILMNKIYVIRDQKVMLDRDLAQLYNVKPFRLREQVKRNADKFPPHFMFQLNEEETNFMVSQNAIPSKQHLGGALPLVFTEYGALQLANVLNSAVATKMSIHIIEIFMRMRKLISENEEIIKFIQALEQKTNGNTKSIELLFEYMDEMMTKKEVKSKAMKVIGFKRCIKTKSAKRV